MGCICCVIKFLKWMSFQLLEENIFAFVKTELTKIQRALSTDYPADLESQGADELVGDVKEGEQLF